jgi:hypothetical protein
MAIAQPGELTVRQVKEFDEAQATWPRGERPMALRAAAEEFRARFKAQAAVRAVRTIDLVTAPYPAAFAFQGAARHINPYVTILNRLVIVQFDDFDGQLRTLAWEPTIPEGSMQAPFYRRLLDRYGEWGERLSTTQFHTVASALASVGLTPQDVDIVSFDHLHVQDLRPLMGTDDVEPLFPNAAFVFQRREVDTLASVHPLQWAWYVPGGMEGVHNDRLALVDGDVELGVGVALLWTPGHTDGNHSLCLNTEDGVWVTSENGVAADNWQPHLSRIPGVREWADAYGREIVMNANTLEDSIDQYDSMLKEKAVADAHREDPRWANVLPSSELVRRRISWPVGPTFFYGGMNYGTITTSR